MSDSVSGVEVGLGATYDPNANKRVTNNALGKDDFLKLMITQMQHQDPLDPMDNTEQIAQQAQFTTLEQMQNMNKSMETLIEVFQSGNRGAAVSMIGADVEGFVSTVDDQNEPVVTTIKGRVKSIDFSGGQTTVVVKNDDGEFSIPFGQVNRVTDPRGEEEI